jgi:hypothetical protein
MDMIVKQAGGGRWKLIDLLGRDVGDVVKSGERFDVHPSEHGGDAMLETDLGPFHTLDDALAAIERHTRGLCRLEAEEPSGAPRTEDSNQRLET